MTTTTDVTLADLEFHVECPSIVGVGEGRGGRVAIPGPPTLVRQLRYCGA